MAAPIASLSAQENGRIVGRVVDAEQGNPIAGVWTGRTGDAGPNGSFGFSVGGEDPVFGQRFGYIGSFSYSYNQ